MRAIAVYDTFRGAEVELELRAAGKVGIYACGPTVYAPIHVGNARPFVTFAVFKRFLEHVGYDVTLVVNITDVNDKIYDAARERGVASESLVAEMTECYLSDTDALGLGRPDHEPRAAQSIEAIVELIEALIASDHAYAVAGDVYFRVRSFPAYGGLSNRALEDMVQAEGDEARVDIKESPQDFALWKARKPDEDTAWPSPWGEGRPGWHIECSAMAEGILGTDFDIHGGGIDLVFPHHENEIAQSEAGRDERLARVWMHNGMVRLADEKMSKSLGNIQPLGEALKRYGRDAIVMWLLSGHYRRPLAFTDEIVGDAGRSVERIREFCGRLDPSAPPPDALTPYSERFLAALADDFNTPAARSALFDWVAEGNRRLDSGERLGVGDLATMLDVIGFAHLVDGEGEAPPPEAERLAVEREAARAARDFATADRKRDELTALGWEVRDGAEGSRLVPLQR